MSSEVTMREYLIKRIIKEAEYIVDEMIAVHGLL